MSSILDLNPGDTILADKTVEDGVTKYTPQQSGISNESKDNPSDKIIYAIDDSTGTTPIEVKSSDSANTFVHAGSGADTITGGFLADTIYGGAGNDSIEGGKAADLILGQDGDDVIYGDSATDLIPLVRDGNDTIYGGAGNDLIFGGSGDDLLYGDDGNDTLFGDAGNDTLFGGAGNDSLIGGAGNDKLFGGAGNDTLEGGAGNDTLTGDPDTLPGGADVFKLVNTPDAGVDTITDFETGVDKIQLGGFTGDVSYDQATGSLKVGGTEVAKLGEGTAFDVDPDGGADWEII